MNCRSLIRMRPSSLVKARAWRAGAADGRLVNLRDLGGLPAGRGVTSRADVLYRSDAPYADDDIQSQFEVWPPSDVIDLRSPGEFGTSYRWPAGTVVHRIPLLASAAPELQVGPLETLYLHMLDEAAAHIAGLTRVIADARGPVLVHCAVGKDRTGVAVAILLLAAGVDAEAVVADYCVTAPNVARVLGRMCARGHEVPVGVPDHVFQTPAAAIRAVIRVVQNWPGGTTGWLVENGALAADIELWRDRFTGTKQAMSQPSFADR